MESLTNRQHEILAFIEQELENGRSPSQREIAAHFYLAQNAVYQLVGYLKQKGYLDDIGGHRGLRLSQVFLSQKDRHVGLPLVGRVAAGEPILAQENIDSYIDLNDLFDAKHQVGKTRRTNSKVFLLQVHGDSMTDEGILDGDYVVIHRQKTIANGQIGAVLIDDEATVKRIFLQDNRIALQPANKERGYKTMYIKQGQRDVQIIGRVVGCIRKIDS